LSACQAKVVQQFFNNSLIYLDKHKQECLSLRLVFAAQREGLVWGKQYEAEETAGSGKVSGGAGQGLDGRREFRFLGSGFHDGFRGLAAFATLGGNAQLTADFGESGSALRDRVANLTVGNGFAEADVHGEGCKRCYKMLRTLKLMRINVN
jgi:hypothetical protein